MLPPHTDPPMPNGQPDHGEWWLYKNHIEFETTDIFFKQCQMSASKIDNLLEIWAASLATHNDEPLFKNHCDLYSTIDATPLPGGDTEWKTFNLCFHNDEELPPDVPNWKKKKWDVWYCDPLQLIHNLLQNPDFHDKFNYTPFQEYDLDGNHHFHNIMSGNWSWCEAISTSLYIHLLFTTLTATGCYRKRPQDTWCNAYTNYTW